MEWERRAAKESDRAAVEPYAPAMADDLDKVGGDDLPPLGEEARAQRRATSMPLVWAFLALIVAAAFIAALALKSGHGFAVGDPRTAPAPHARS